MLKDYQNYLENIRNDLIQNDVQVPLVELDGYEDIFDYGIVLEQVLSFYQWLSLMNSDYAIQSRYISTESYYDKVRQTTYKEYLENLEGYQSLFVSQYVLGKYQKEYGEIKENPFELLGTDMEFFGDDYVGEESEDKEFEIKEPESSKEQIDLFEDSTGVGILEEPLAEDIEASSSAKTPINFSSFVQSASNSSTDVVKSSQSSSTRHGIYIDMWESGEDSTDSEESIKGISHGIYIDLWEFNEDKNMDDWSDLGDWGESDEEEGSPSKKCTNHGVYIDLWESDDWSEYSYEEEDKGNEIEDEEEEVDWSEYTCEEDEDGIEELEDQEDLEDVDWSEYSFEDDEEDEYGEELEDQEEDLEDVDWSEYSFEDDEEEVQEEEEEDDWSEYTYEEDESEEGPEGSEDTDWSMEENSESSQGNKGISQESTSFSEPVVEDLRDISDDMQDITNKLLTKGKRFLKRSFDKLNE